MTKFASCSRFCADWTALVLHYVLTYCSRLEDAIHCLINYFIRVFVCRHTDSHFRHYFEFRKQDLFPRIRILLHFDHLVVDSTRQPCLLSKGRDQPRDRPLRSGHRWLPNSARLSHLHPLIRFEFSFCSLMSFSNYQQCLFVVIAEQSFS